MMLPMMMMPMMMMIGMIGPDDNGEDNAGQIGGGGGAKGWGDSQLFRLLACEILANNAHELWLLAAILR